MTGMSMSGKMSVGIRKIVTTPGMTMSIDITTNVYGRLSAMRTSHIIDGLASVPPAARFDAEVGGAGARPSMRATGEGVHRVFRILRRPCVKPTRRGGPGLLP